MFCNAGHLFTCITFCLFCLFIVIYLSLKLEGLNEIRPAVYRAALKLHSLQKLCQSESFSVYVSTKYTFPASSLL